MLNFYESENFKLFPCNLKKVPDVPKGTDWRDSQNHLTQEEAERIMSTGGFVGAWIPENIIVIDVDMNHKDKEGKPKPDGLGPFKELLKELGIIKDPFKSTLVVKTGSGGYHLYFRTKSSEISQRAAAESVDIRTHRGYVIAAGTSGYEVFNKAPLMELPPELEERLLKNGDKKAKKITPIKKLSFKKLEKLLSKLDVKHFNNNDIWLEFVTATIATAGNSEDVLQALKEWSMSDPAYQDDGFTIQKRLESIEPDGAVTAGTFLYILKREEISKYLYDQVRMDIGAEFSFSTEFSSNYSIPFKIDFSKIHDYLDLIKALYYSKHQMAGVSLFAELTKENLLYSIPEKSFYYFDGNKWVETPGIIDLLFAVLLHAGERFYTDIGKQDADSHEYMSGFINYIGSLSSVTKIESAIKQHPKIIREAVSWDSPDLEATLTLDDTVMDFSGDKLHFRKGSRDEYRRRYIQLKEADFANPSQPQAFKEFLGDVFPDLDTRKTATYALSTMISGTGKFRKFQIWNGNGKNGKSSLMNVVKMIIGDRAITYKPDVLLAKRDLGSSGPSPELAAFRGALVAMSSETEEVKRISQGTVKQLTGNETMTANPKYQSMIEFHTTFQLVLATNYLPIFSAHDNAFIDRLLTIPFYTAFYSSEDEKQRAENKGARYFIKAKDLKETYARIKEERADILYYLAMRYMEVGEAIPESKECRELKSNYVDSNDDFGKLLEDFCEYDSSEQRGWFTPTKDLVKFFNEEANANYKAKFVVMRVKEVYPLALNASRMVNERLTRGLKNLRLKYGVVPEGGFSGNFTPEEKTYYDKEYNTMSLNTHRF